MCVVRKVAARDVGRRFLLERGAEQLIGQNAAAAVLPEVPPTPDAAATASCLCN